MVRGLSTTGVEGAMMMKIMQQRLLLCMVILSLVALAYAVPKLHDDASTHRFNVLRKKIRESG